jgi:hypothetical protein
VIINEQSLKFVIDTKKGIAEMGKETVNAWGSQVNLKDGKAVSCQCGWQRVGEEVLCQHAIYAERQIKRVFNSIEKARMIC